MLLAMRHLRFACRAVLHQQGVILNSALLGACVRSAGGLTFASTAYQLLRET